MPLVNSIAAAADDLKEWRQDFHRHPELGYEEKRTSRVVAEKLRAFGLDDVQEGIGRMGVVGVLHGRNGPGDEPNAIMIRADMDALPIHEATGLDYKSQTDGLMHACGHDGHTTMLLGAARHMADTRNFDGTVYFCFQPAEENGGGADEMMKDGLFTRFPCRAIYGMHNWPGAPVGSFATRAGPVMAACDEFIVTITGKGGHAAYPHQTRDPIACGAAIVQSLQTIPSRRVDPLQPCVVSVTQFHAGSAANIIPESVMLNGTVRAFDQGVYDHVYVEMERVVNRIADAYDMKAEVNGGNVYYPPTVNDPDQTDFCLDVAHDVFGEAVNSDPPMSMGSEDFSFYALEKPACFVLCGNGDSAMLHHPAYDFNDEAAPWGASYWARLIERALPA